MCFGARFPVVRELVSGGVTSLLFSEISCHTVGTRVDSHPCRSNNGTLDHLAV